MRAGMFLIGFGVLAAGCDAPARQEVPRAAPEAEAEAAVEPAVKVEEAAAVAEAAVKVEEADAVVEPAVKVEEAAAVVEPAAAEARPVEEEPPVEEVRREPAAAAFDRGWLSDTRQVKNVASLYAKGLKGPLEGRFSGYVACKVSVLRWRWDDVPFAPPSKQGPDILVLAGDSAVTLPEDRASGIVGFPGVVLDPAGEFKVVVKDVDPLANDDIDAVVLAAAGGFPMEARTDEVVVSCVGVPAEVYAKDMAARRAAAETAVARVEGAAIDLMRPQASDAALLAAQEAILQWSMLAGRSEVDALVVRLEQSQVSWRRRLFAAIDENVGATPGEWRALASVKVRARVGSDAVEILAEKPLRYDWVARRLGPLRIWFIGPAGQRMEPAFPDLKVGEKEIDAFNVRVAKGETVVLRSSFDVRGAVYVVISEGKQVLYAPLAG